MRFTMWRRGWDSNPVSPFILRKLLILHKATIARTATVAQVGYSFGTHSLARLIFGAVWLLALLAISPIGVFAQSGQRWDGITLSPSGRPVPALVSVCNCARLHTSGASAL